MHLYLLMGDESRTAKLVNHMSHENLESRWHQRGRGWMLWRGLATLKKWWESWSPRIWQSPPINRLKFLPDVVQLTANILKGGEERRVDRNSVLLQSCDLPDNQLKSLVLETFPSTSILRSDRRWNGGSTFSFLSLEKRSPIIRSPRKGLWVLRALRGRSKSSVLLRFIPKDVFKIMSSLWTLRRGYLDHRRGGLCTW
jgi:hypothetical protein